MCLTFKEIKEKCVPGETIFLGENNDERYFIGFTHSGKALVTGTSLSSESAITWYENEIFNWKIKLKMKKIVVDAWINIYPDGGASLYNSKREANRYAADNRIDCFHFYKEYEVEDK